MPYALRSGISFCMVEERPVFLDLFADRYFGLSPTLEAAFLHVANGGETEPARLPPFLAACLLDPADTSGGISACAAPEAIEALTGDSQRSTASDTLAAAGWLARSHLALRTGHLASAIQHLAARKAALPACTAIDAADIRTSLVASSFAACARWMSAHGRCLPWSLAIAHRLVSVGVSPLLFLGVRLTPFKAHAWVQVDRTVVVERLETTRMFTPILVV
ncbi:lasso peptide biosynthesis B2 protein [Novosphingobium lindaniclasticum]